MAIKKLIKRYKNKVIDVTSDVMSAPSRYFSNKKMSNANMEAKILRNAKQIPDAAVVGKDYRDEGFRTRVMAENIKDKYRNKRY